MGSEENKQLGFIVLFRSLVDWEWFTDQNTLQVFLYCLLSANHKDKNYKGTLIERGSFVTSYEVISQKCGLTRMQVRTAIKHLKNSENLTTTFNGKGLIISIKNYDDYQNRNTQITPKEHAGNTQITPNNNDNNVNKVVVVDNIDYTAEFLEFWDVYKRKRYMADTFEYWQKMDITPELKKEIIYGAKRYCESEKDLRSLVFPRTFLENRIWRDYPEPKDEDDLSYYLRSKGY